MPEPDDEFYDLSSPTFLQQGDIFPNIPLMTVPPSRDLVVVREVETRAPWIPSPGVVEALDELTVNAFSEGNREHIIVSAERGMGLLLTQTCDLTDNDYWLVCPAFTLEGTSIDVANLFAGKYQNLLGLPQHPLGHFDPCFVNLNDMRQIAKDSVVLADRVASVTPRIQHAIADKIGQMLGRTWGYGDGEDVPQTGLYKCYRCNFFMNLENPAREFPAGTKFPVCDNCARIHKRAQWYQLRKHKKY